MGRSAPRLLLRGLTAAVATLGGLLGWLFTTGALWFGHLPIGPLRPVLGIAFAVGFPLLLIVRPARRGTTLLAFLILCDTMLVHILLVRPSNHRQWADNQAVLPWAELDGELLTVHNIRNTDYRADDSYTVRHYDRTFDLRRLDSLDYIVVPFKEFAPGAHTMVSFGFGGEAWLAISVEARKEQGEEYGIFPGFYRHFELIYVAGDERDLVGVRANLRKDTVYVYPARTTRPMMRRMLLDMVERMNQLRERPEFYDTFAKSCTTTIVEHVNRIAPERVPFSLSLLFPSSSDELALDLDLLDVEDLPIDDLRALYRVSEAAGRHAGAPDFSRRIREGRKR